MGSLNGKVAVVTGASKGIGAGIAKAFAAEGASVVVNYASSREGADKTVKSITDAGGKAVAVQGDVARQADVDRLFEEANKAFGKLDILVNNAGVFDLQPLDAVTEENFHRHFNINVLGMLLATQAAARIFGEAGGNVINIGSVVSTLNLPNTVVYTATKGAVNSITHVLSKELGPKGIRVNSINPGMVETEGASSMPNFDQMRAGFEPQIPLRRIGQPDDIAKAAVFLASDASSWLTGETIAVSGGMH